MRPGIDDTDLTKTDTIRRTAVIDRQLDMLDVDIAALQETRLADSGMLKEKHYTFFWQGLGPEDPRLYGVGFAVKNKLLANITTPKGDSERIISLKLSTKNGLATIISVYSPTLSAENETKNKFYEDLQRIVNNVPPNEQLYILGDFNARVGSDYHSWPTCLGHFGIGKMNENGQRLLEFCSDNSLSITNTFYNGKNCRKVSWKHPRSGHWHQIDFVLVRKSDLNTVKSTRSYHSADCDTDHILIISKTKLCIKKSHRAKPPNKGRLNIRAMKSPDKKALFEKQLEQQLTEFDKPTADESWEQLKTAIHNCASQSFGHERTSKTDWIEENESTLTPLLELKRKALITYNKNSTKVAANQLREAKSNLQRESRRCANKYWQELCSDIQRASDMGDIRTMYEKIRTALGPQVSKLAPLKSSTGDPICDKKQQMDRWVEHYSQLYSCERSISEDLENEIPPLPIMTELDKEPTEDELSRAIDYLRSGKATGNDNIPAELLKENKNLLLPHLYHLLIQCWTQETIPHDMRDANIVTLYKNKGDKGDCNNYRGISLLSITGKTFARILLQRLNKLAYRVLPESQCGFRSSRSTIDMIFSLRQLQEKCREQNKPLHIAFVDLTKAFDTVSRSGLYMVLEKIGIPPKLLKLVKSFHDDMKATVQSDGSKSDSFYIKSGVKQGCVLAPTLFGIYFAVLLQYAFKESPGNVYLHWRTDGSLFNLTRLKAKTKITESNIRDLLFADDAALVAHDETTLQELMNRLSSACKSFALEISSSKTVTMTQGATTPAHISLNNKQLASVEQFTYLGSTMTSTLSLEEELNTRIGKAATTFGKLSKRAWNNKMLTRKTKVLIYEACVLSTLLYGSEAWTICSAQEKRLNSFHLRCLRKIMNVPWQDRVTNSDVLALAQLPSMMSILCKRRLRWLGHVRRMDDTRIPKQFLYGELQQGTRARGRPKLRFKDLCKRNMTKCDIDHKSWDMLAENRAAWKSKVTTGVKKLEHDRNTALHEQRLRRKETKNPPGGICLKCKSCGRICLSNIGRVSHEKSCLKIGGAKLN